MPQPNDLSRSLVALASLTAAEMEAVGVPEAGGPISVKRAGRLLFRIRPALFLFCRQTAARCTVSVDGVA